MWVTVNEASGRWCPFARVYEGETQAVSNRSISSNGEPWVGDHHMCLADNCMAWRERVLADKPTRGYCGLAGKPELMRE